MRDNRWLMTYFANYRRSLAAVFSTLITSKRRSTFVNRIRYICLKCHPIMTDIEKANVFLLFKTWRLISSQCYTCHGKADVITHSLCRILTNRVVVTVGIITGTRPIRDGTKLKLCDYFSSSAKYSFANKARLK